MSRVDRTETADGGVRYRIEVDEPSPDRIDRYLSERLPLSRTHIAELITAEHVTIGGQTPKKSYVPESGDLIVVDVPAAEPTELVPEAIPLDVVHEDEWLIVVNKPAGMVVHPAPGHRRGTLVNALLHHSGKLSDLGGDDRPGIVHRLDKDTSGLIIVARDRRVHRRLSDALSRRAISRRYLAASWGHLDQDELVVEAPVGRRRGDRKLMGVVPGGRPAGTEIQRLEYWTAADFLSVGLRTGRTHQIRVHLRYLGHPVVGDRQYGADWERGFSGDSGLWARELARRVTRQFLHAAELAFEHPVTGESMRFSADLPDDLQKAAEWARRTS